MSGHAGGEDFKGGNSQGRLYPKHRGSSDVDKAGSSSSDEAEGVKLKETEMTFNMNPLGEIEGETKGEFKGETKGDENA